MVLFSGILSVWFVYFKMIFLFWGMVFLVFEMVGEVFVFISLVIELGCEYYDSCDYNFNVLFFVYV